MTESKHNKNFLNNYRKCIAIANIAQDLASDFKRMDLYHITLGKHTFELIESKVDKSFKELKVAKTVIRESTDGLYGLDYEDD